MSETAVDLDGGAVENLEDLAKTGLIDWLKGKAHGAIEKIKGDKTENPLIKGTMCDNCVHGNCQNCGKSAAADLKKITGDLLGDKVNPKHDLFRLEPDQKSYLQLALAGDFQALQKLQESLQQQNQPDKPKLKETLVILDQEPKKTEEPKQAVVKQTEITVDETAILARKSQEDLLLRDFLRRKDEEREVEKAKESKGEVVIGDKRSQDELKKAESVSFFVPVDVKTESALVTKRDDSAQPRSVGAKTETRSAPRTRSRVAGSARVGKKGKAASPRAKTSARVGRAPNSRDPRARDLLAVRLAKASRLKPLRALRKERASLESAKALDTTTKQRLKRGINSQIEVVRNSRRAKSVATERTSKRETLNTAQTELANKRQSQQQSASQLSQQQATLQARQQQLVSQQQANQQARLQSQRAAEQALQDQLLRQQLASRLRPTERTAQRNEPAKIEQRLGIPRKSEVGLIDRQEKQKGKSIEIKKAAELIGGLEPKRLNPEIIKALLTVSSRNETREIVKALKSLSSESQKILLGLDKKEALRDVLKLLATKTNNNELKDLLKTKPTDDVLRQIREITKNLTTQSQETLRLARDQLAREIMLLIDQEADRKKKDALTKAIRKLLEDGNDLEKMLISLKALSELRAKIKFKTPEKVEEKILKDQEERAKENETESADEIEVKKGGKFKQQGPSTTLDIFQAQVDDGDKPDV